MIGHHLRTSLLTLLISASWMSAHQATFAQGPPSAFDTGNLYGTPADKISPLDVQKALVWTGHYDGTVDGLAGKGTQASIAAWQRANGFVANGSLSADQALALLKQGLQQRRNWEWASYLPPDGSFSIGVPRRLFKDPTPTGRPLTRFEGVSPGYEITVTSSAGQSRPDFAARFAELNQTTWTRTIEFSVSRDDWWVVSGFEEKSAFYTRAERADSAVVIMTFRLPRDKVQEQGLLVTAVANSFKANDSSVNAPRRNAPPAVSNDENCLRTGQVATGVLGLARRTHPNGTPMSAYVLRLPAGSCATMPSMDPGGPDQKTVPIREIHLAPSDDAQGREMEGLEGRAIKVRLDELFPAHTAWHFGDAVSTKFVLLSPGAPPSTPAGGPSRGMEIAMQRSGGTYAIPVQINQTITLDFILDSGASDVTIPSDVFGTLIRAGTITKDDVLGSQTYTLADGSSKKAMVFRIRSLQVGNIRLENVQGSVGDAAGPLLLGMSFLGRFPSWAVDNTRHVLMLR